MTLERAILLRTLYSSIGPGPSDNIAGALDIAIRLNEYQALPEDEAGLLNYLKTRCDEITPGKFKIKDSFLEEKTYSNGKNPDGTPKTRIVKVLKTA